MASLHTDLREIREKSGQSVSDLNSKTKTPISVLHEIEKGVFFEKGDKQKTYIRSFVRTYAKAIGIKDEDIIRALDAQEAGLYSGGLRKKYLPETVHGDLENPELTEYTNTSSDISKDDEDTGLVRPGPTSTIGHDEFSRPDPSRQHNRVTPPPPKLDSIDWAKFNDRFPQFNAPILTYALIAFVVILLGTGGYYGYVLITHFSGSGSDEQSAVDAMQTNPETGYNGAPDSASRITDTDSLTALSPETPDIVQRIALPEVIHLVVYAQRGKLEPVRITSDVNNTRSPYWIEQNEAIRFDFYNKIRVEGTLERASLLINGHIIADLDSLTLNTNTVEITRDFLSRRPYLFNNSRPVLPDGFTQPTVIRDRPVF